VRALTCGMDTLHGWVGTAELRGVRMYFSGQSKE